METPLMNFCCQELEELQGRIFTDNLDCIKQHREFTMVVLEEEVLILQSQWGRTCPGTCLSSHF